MSPIIDLQRRVAEVGRIRIGTSTKNARGKKVPKRLSTFRLTSQDPSRLEAAAKLYGGTVAPWEDRPGHFELVTDTNALPVLVMPGQALSQWWELWAGGECKRRCDGERETIGDTACLCPPYDERTELAGQGKACKPTTRVNVILREVPGVGYWRFESHGFYAAVELAGAVELLEEATSRGALLPARLRFEERTVVRGAQTKRFPVPSLDVDVTVRQLVQIAQGGLGSLLPAAAPAGELEAGGGAPALEAGETPAAGSPEAHGHTPAPARSEGVTVAEGLAAVNRETEPRRTARSAEPIGARPARAARPLEVPDEDGAVSPADEPKPSGGQSPAPTPNDATGAQEAAQGAESEATVDEVVEGEVVEDADVVDPDDPFPGEKYVTQAQAKLIHTRATKGKVSEEELDRIILILTTGRTQSAAKVPARLLDNVLESIKQASE